MIVKSAIFALVFPAGMPIFATYATSEPSAYRRVVVEERKTRTVEDRRHVVVPRYKAASAKPLKKRMQRVAFRNDCKPSCTEPS